MPTATSPKIRSQQQRLSASMHAVVATIRQPFLEKSAAISEAQKGMEQDLQQVLREGMEREALRDTLATVRSQIEGVAAWFRGMHAIFEGDEVVVPAIESQLQETERFLSWVRRLEARVLTPCPPFDESRLSPAPTGPTAEGYLRVRDARTQAGKPS